MSGPAGKGRVDLDGTRQALEQLGLLHAGERLGEMLSEAVKQNLAVHTAPPQQHLRSSYNDLTGQGSPARRKEDS